MSFIAIAKIFAKPGKRDELVETLKPEATFVEKEESITDAYYFFKPVDEPDTLLGIEVYPSREALFDTHMGSDAFKAFAAASADLNAKQFELDFYEPANVGFLTRKEYSKLQGPDVYILLVEYTFKPGMRDTVLSWMAEIAEDVFENEAGCFSYYYGKSLDNPDKIMIFERYVDRPALEVIHRGAKTFLDVFDRMAKEEVVVVRKVYDCTESGVGFLARD